MGPSVAWRAGSIFSTYWALIHGENLPRNSPASLLKGNCRRSSSPDEAKKRLCPASDLLQENRQIERAAETESVPAHACGIKQGHVGEALE